MTSGLRRFTLTVHVVTSVGWIGAVAVFLALSVVGLTSPDDEAVRGVYLAMEPIGWAVLVPLSFASLLTGLVQSLGTKWGLFRHYWVLIKLVINVAATTILLLYMQTLAYLAGIAAASPPGDVSGLRDPSPALHAGVGIVLLLVAATLSVYKPRGMTRYGQRRQRTRSAAPAG